MSCNVGGREKSWWWSVECRERRLVKCDFHTHSTPFHVSLAFTTTTLSVFCRFKCCRIQAAFIYSIRFAIPWISNDTETWKCESTYQTHVFEPVCVFPYDVCNLFFPCSLFTIFESHEEKGVALSFPQDSREKRCMESINCRESVRSHVRVWRLA